MVEMHLLSVNVDYRYDPIYALGVVTSFDRFMQGYRPEGDKGSIFDGICQALQDDPNRYRGDAERLRTFASQRSPKDVVSWLEQAATAYNGDDLQEQVKAIANNPKHKYSRLFAIGLFTMLETADANAVKDEAQRTELLSQACAALRLPQDKVQKDLELYRSNLEKMAQAQAAMADMMLAEKKKREKRLQENGTPESPDQGTSDSTEAPKNEATFSS